MTDDETVAERLARLATPTSNGANRVHRCSALTCDLEGEGVREYLNGYYCDEHSPWALAGRPRIAPPPRVEKVRPESTATPAEVARQRQIGKRARDVVDDLAAKNPRRGGRW